ncbi:hypothetical protein KTD19_12475 [Burkholderia multivorans]|uniref:hypothetical protein n=1 Tax=Burkholderia multivorans TaxID=87883 RepID=UPI0012DCB500|nr:hypothetical protein [Burkholderia multivorans]MBU9233208.1 hypothetical protein [Burkholderia multivorans]QGR95080.1 hypothetical protein FOC30_30150 [Burkholderia multivorans]HEF4739717.1 hypothetical protein [Burkholderia multivorans]
MKPSVHELRHNGVHVRLTIGPQAMVAEAQAGRFMRPVKVRASHHGLLGPGTRRPHESAFAKCLIDEAVCKALGRPPRSPFDLLLDDLFREMQRSERPLRKALVLLRKPARRR